MTLPRWRWSPKHRQPSPGHYRRPRSGGRQAPSCTEPAATRCSDTRHQSTPPSARELHQFKPGNAVPAREHTSPEACRVAAPAPPPAPELLVAEEVLVVLPAPVPEELLDVLVAVGRRPTLSHRSRMPGPPDTPGPDALSWWLPACRPCHPRPPLWSRGSLRCNHDHEHEAHHSGAGRAPCACWVNPSFPSRIHVA